MINTRVGRWTLIERLNCPEGTLWLCRCKCGREKKVWQRNLRSGRSKGCMACAKSVRRKVLVGKHFGEIEVLREAGWGKPAPCGKRPRLVRCRCGYCRREFTAVAGKLKRRKSCGCLLQEAQRSLGARNTTRALHGESHPATAEYKTFCGMLRRCYSGKYPYYTSVRVCKRWRHSYVNFLHDMGRKPSARHTLDRIDNTKNYGPANCRWATIHEQARNRRNNIYLSWSGTKRSLAEWAALHNVPYYLAYSRYRKGWPPYKILTQEIRRRAA